MFQLAVFIAATPEKASVMDALPHLMGFVAVIITLTALWLICLITGKLIQFLLPPPATPPPRAASTKPPEDTIPPEVLAVIAAAVTATVGKSRRIISVQPTNPAWTQAGRQQILTSHKVR